MMTMRHMGKSLEGASDSFSFLRKRCAERNGVSVFPASAIMSGYTKANLKPTRRWLTQGDEQVQENHREAEQNQEHTAPAAQLNTAPDTVITDG